MPAFALGGLAVGSAIAGGIASHNAAGAIQGAAKNANNSQLAFNAKNNAALAPFTNFGTNSADKLAFLLGEKSPSADTSSIESSLSGMTPAQALQSAQTMGSPMVSASKEQTQSWIDQGVPFKVVNGIAVRTDGGSGNTMDATQAGGGFGSLLKPFDNSMFQADPGFQFRLQQGEQAIQRAAAARGASYSGGTLKALDQYDQGQAAQEFAAANDRYNTNRNMTYSFLMGPTQLGANETNTGVAANENTANAINNNTMAGGQAAAAGDLGIGNAVANGLNGIGNAYIYSQMPAAPAYPSTVPSTTGAPSTAGTTIGSIPVSTPPFLPNGSETQSTSPLNKLRLN
jgi:hypothetical protein